MINPLVSVIIPTYNRRCLLQKAIDSVYSQEYPSIELIVVGDHCDPDEIRVRIKESDTLLNLDINHGAGGAIPRNCGLSLARGDWIAYLDDDNTWKSNHLSSLMKLVGYNLNVDFAFSSMEISGKSYPCDRPIITKVDTSCILHRKSLISECGLWKTRREVDAHDWELVNRWVLTGKKWIASMEPTVVYNIATSSHRLALLKLIGEL